MQTRFNGFMTLLDVDVDNQLSFFVHVTAIFSGIETLAKIFEAFLRVIRSNRSHIIRSECQMGSDTSMDGEKSGFCQWKALNTYRHHY